MVLVLPLLYQEYVYMNTGIESQYDMKENTLRKSDSFMACC